jgi:GT2 family glycosyltransferase
METLAPSVVAVVVAHDPGPWFEETLASLASQDYAELSVLVLDDAGTEDVTARVAAVLPTAYVRRLEENRGFGATVNEVRAMVDGASYFLFCHDDVALFPDTTHLLVEEAFRSNAGIISPKVVSWSDPDRLIHVGMTVDKGGSVAERVLPNEIDHGQHDAVRDVFVAPGGCTLVRADLFEELEGFDPAIVAMGEDLDLCWRAQVVGARIIVAPDARVRHLEELASGSCSLEESLLASGSGTAPGSPVPGRHPVTLQELQRRHELLAVFKCYGRFHLVRVVPQVLILAIGEVIVAGLGGNRLRARAVVRAWRWNLGRLPTVGRQRARLRAHRRLGDKEIRLLQVGGSARLSAYARRFFQQGFHGAHADELAAPGEDADAVLGVPVAAAVERGRSSGQARLVTWLVATLVVVVGSRGVLGGRLPALGQFTPFPGWSSTIAQFFTGWHPSGVGTTAPATPALALAGLVGTVLLGAMGLAQKVLVFACVPLGVWGVVRLLRPFGSQRASLVAGLAYLAMALPYDALALGRWGALVTYAGAPWILALLFRATDSAPFGAPGGAALAPPADSGGPEGDPQRAPSVAGRWAAFNGRHGRLGSMLALGLVEAVLVSFVPAAAVVVVLAAVALVVFSIFDRDWRSGRRALELALGATVVAGVICLPWLIGVLSAGRGAVAVFGVPTPTSDAASWGSLLRFAVGPIGASPLAWGFAVAALVPLVLARGARFRWAARFWTIALVFWVVAWAIGRGWTGSLAIDPLVLLGPAAVAIAAAIGLGIAAFEVDLRRAEFGWRQLVTVVAIGAVVLGSVPTLVSALPGRWDLPINDFSQSMAWMQAKAADGSFRVLWLGDPRSLNQGSWSAGGGLAYATSEDGSPDARWLWNAAGPGPASDLASAVDLARSDRTDQLGSMLAPAGVRYVVLLTSVAPEISGEQSPQQYPVPSGVAPALARQLDLTPVISGTGLTVYDNAAWIPERAEVAGGVAPVATTSPGVLAAAPGSKIVPRAQPVLPGPVASRVYRGPVSKGTVLTALAPAGSWSLITSSGVPAPRAASFGWAGSYRVDAAGAGTLRFDGGLLVPLSALLSIVGWLIAVAALVGRRRHRLSWRPPGGGRRRRDADDPSASDAARGEGGTPVAEVVS